jgi:hypothetical protein
MKQLLLAISILIGTSIQAQQIPNGSFENWVQEPYGEEPANWGEFSLQLLNSISLGIIDSTIVKSQDAYSGTYAMELRSKALSGALTDTIVPLVMLNLKNSNLDSAKMKIDGPLLSLSGYIKQDLVIADSNSTSISVVVYAGGSITGIGAMEFDMNIVDYTSFDIPILYFGGIAGDSIEVLIAGGNSNAPVPGNIMLLDDFELHYLTAATKEETNSSEISVYPNPFNDQLIIELQSSSSKEFKIYSILGEMVLKGTVNSDMNTIDLSNLSPNIYFLKIENQSIKLIKQN